MSAHYNALIVVLGITMIVFYLAKPLMIEFMAVEDFVRRRNIWLCLVIAAFLVSNYWLYVLIATVLLAYGVKHDTNPAALYLFLLLAIPPFPSEIPTFGLINQIFTLDHLRLLSLVILLPVAVGLNRSVGTPEAAEQWAISGGKKLLLPDVLILSYVGLQLILVAPHVSVTDSIRRVLLFGIDILLPYFVLSRACRTRGAIADVMASFALAAAALACMAVFENLKSWLLFSSLEDSWNSLSLTSFLRRGDSLRAQVTAGHSIVLGYALAAALGFWLYLQSKVAATRLRWLALLSLVAGLAATLARGPWLGALAMVLLYFALGPRAVSRLLKVLSALTVAAGLLLASPWGTDFVDRLPFIGTADQEGSVVYRQRVAATSWLLIQQNPFFGNLSAGESMEELRQGEGIIDMVNTYAYIALAYGLVGLGLFAVFFGVIVVNCLRAVRRFTATDPDFSLLGSALLASVVGGLLIIATVGLYLSIGYLIWAVAGLAVAYTQLARKVVTQEPNPRGTYDRPGSRINPPEWRT
jgi:hypothetical protein